MANKIKTKNMNAEGIHQILYFSDRCEPTPKKQILPAGFPKDAVRHILRKQIIRNILDIYVHHMIICDKQLIHL